MKLIILLKSVKRDWLKLMFQINIYLLKMIFIVSIECIHLENDINIEEENKRIRFSSKLFSGPFIWRNNVNVEWNERRAKYNVGIGIHLKVEEYSK